MAKSNNIKATISLDDSRFNNSIRNINSSLKAVNSAFAVSKSEIDRLGATTNTISQLQDKYRAKIDLLRQKQTAYTQAIQKEQQALQKNQQEHTRLQQAYNQQQQKITQLTVTHGKNSAEVRREEEVLKRLSSELQRNERAITNNNGKINSYTTTVNKAQVEINNAERELNDLSQSFNNTSQQVQQTNSILNQFSLNNVLDGLQGITSQISSAFDKINSKIIGFGKDVFSVGMEFEKSMSNVKAVSGETEENMAKLEQQAKDLGGSTIKSSKDVSDGYGYMAMAGWKANQMLEAMPTLLNLSIASGEDMALTCDIVTDALTAFGKQAEDAGRLADIMASASSNANTNVAMLGESFKYVAPVAGSLKYSMEDTALALGLMANSGIKAGQAGTALRAGLVNLVKPTDAMEKTMKKYGISVKDSSGKMLSFRDLMGQLRTKLGDLDEATQSNVVSTIFGKEAMSGWMAIINASASDFDKLKGAIDNSNGACNEMADIMGDNVYGKVENLKSQMEALKLKAFDALYPTIIKIMEALSGFLDKLNNMDEETMNNIITMAKYSLILGTVFKGLNFLVGGASNVIKVFSGVKGLFTALGGATATASAGATAVATSTASAGASAVASSGMIATLGGALSKVASFMAGPWGLAIAGGVAVGAYAIKKGSEDCVKEVDLFADGMVDSEQKIVDAYGNTTNMIVKEQVKISEATKSRLEGILKMEDEHSKKMTEIAMRKREITDKEIEEMKMIQRDLNNGMKEEDKKTAEDRLKILKDKYIKEKEIIKTEEELLTKQMNEINELTKQRIDEKYTSEKETLLNHLVEVQGMKKEDALKELEFMDENKKNQTKFIEDKQKEYMEKLKEYFNDENGLTVEEHNKLKTLQDELKNYRIQSLSDTELEANLIQNRMKEYSTSISAEQMGALIKDAESVRKARIKEANEEFIEYERILTEQKATSNTLTDEQYLNLIDKAKTARDDKIRTANEEKVGVLKELESLNKDAYDSVDKNSGEILSRWSKFWSNLTSDTGDNAQDALDEMDKLKNGIDNLPNYSKKVVEIQTKYTETGNKANSGYKGGSMPYNMSRSLNNYRSINKNDIDKNNKEFNRNSINREVDNLKNSINRMNSTMVNVAQTINKVPATLSNMKDNLQVVNNNVIRLDKRAFTDVVDGGLQKNKKKSDVFLGKNRSGRR